jgi:hypothetical protein
MVKEQRETTKNIIRDYRELTEHLLSELARHDTEEAAKHHDQFIQLKKDTERVGLK